MFTTPAGSLGTISITITNTDGKTSTLADTFTYEQVLTPDFDLDKSGKVDFGDFMTFALAFGS